jgi:hypothetical protein
MHGVGPDNGGVGRSQPIPRMAVDSLGQCHVRCNSIPSDRRAHRYSSASGGSFISMLIFMKETRSSIILIRMARKVRKDTGDGRYRARVEENKPSLASMIAISCTRPLCKYIHRLQTIC